MFGSRFDPTKVYGRRKNRKSRAIGGPNDEWRSVDMESSSDDEQSQEASAASVDGAQSSEGEVSSLDEHGGVRIRPPQEQSEVNFSVGGERGKAEKIEESADDLEKRRQGAKRAEEREMVRRAARRVIVFGVEVPKTVEVRKPTKKSKRGREEDEGDERASTEMRKAEALMNGMVVEPSFAKGNWSIRWRE